MTLFSGLRVSQLNRLALAVLLVFMATTSLWSQTTIRVPEDQPTIQDGIGVANPGDTVLVGPGTYVENLFFFGGGYTVKSTAGPEVTIIVGDGVLPTVRFQPGQGVDTGISGFTITNGGSEGGVFVLSASPTITNNIISNNTTCGIQVANLSSPVITNNTISNNPSACPSPFGGAGISIEANGAPVISGNRIINNGSDTNATDGGGIGVGTFSGTGNAVITNNTIKGNKAQMGGGINVSLGANPAITQNLIVENVGSFGGGVAISSASGSLTSNTIANNDGLSIASALYIADSPLAPLTLMNNLIIGRSGSTALVCGASSPDLALANNDVFALNGVAYDGPCAPATPDPNLNISADPMFDDPSQSNYRLQAGSPALDRGTNSAPNLLQHDFEGQLRILDGDEDSIDVIDIGAYERALVVFTPSPLDFGPRAVGSSVTLPLNLTLKNRAATLTFQPLPELTGDTQDFVQTNDCLDLAPGDSCTFNFTFTPQVLGARRAVLKVSRLEGQALLPLAIVSVMGEGVEDGPAPIELEITPASLDFPAQRVGTTSQSQRVSLNAPAAFVVNQVTVSGPFQHVVSCSAPAPCHVDVSFAPVARGPVSGVMTIHSNAVGSPHTVPLSGTGVAPVASVSPTAVDFGGQAVGSTSSQNLALTNNGDAALNIASISTSNGVFGQTHNCSSVLAAGASCTIAVTFTPNAVGPHSGTLSISSDSLDPVPPVTLAGGGVVPVAGVTPNSLSFGNQRVGVPSASQAVGLSNNGGAALQITQITVVGSDFAQNNNCGTVLASGASCSISVTFTPTAVGLRTASLRISSNDPGAPAITVPLSGNGVMPIASVSTTALVFGGQVVNTVSAAIPVTLSNTGGDVLQVVSISVSGDFAQTNACGTQVAPGASCIINVMFAPTAAGARAGALTISSNGSALPLSVSLSGTGLTSGPTLAPLSVTFKDTNVGRISHPSKTVTLTANGPGPLQILEITTNGEDFSQTNNCPAVLNAGSSCTITPTFTPVAAGLRTGALRVLHNGPSGVSSVTLSGMGKATGKGKVPLRKPSKF